MTIPPDTYVVHVERSHYWPGGIPTSIRFQPELEIPEDQLKEECRGWIHFLSQNWVPHEPASDTANASDYEAGQRRELMVKWAEVEQSFRDWYHDQAPAVDPNDRICIPKNPPETRSDESDYMPHHSLIVLPKVDQTNPGNHIKWIKQLLLLNRFDGWHENFMSQSDPIHHLILAGNFIGDDGQSGKPPTRKEEVIRWMYLENADFAEICMTRHGQAVCTTLGHFFMLDQSNLDEGSMSVVKFGNNGALKKDFRFRPFLIRGVMVSLYEESFEELLERGALHVNRRFHIDMSGSVLSMLENARAVDPPDFRSPRLAEDVEHYAPGYLALEAQGREAEYDEALLIEGAFGMEEQVCVKPECMCHSFK